MEAACLQCGPQIGPQIGWLYVKDVTFVSVCHSCGRVLGLQARIQARTQAIEEEEESSKTAGPSGYLSDSGAASHPSASDSPSDMRHSLLKCVPFPPDKNHSRRAASQQFKIMTQRGGCQALKADVCALLYVI